MPLDQAQKETAVVFAMTSIGVGVEPLRIHILLAVLWERSFMISRYLLLGDHHVVILVSLASIAGLPG